MLTSWWPQLGAQISRLGFGGMRLPTTADGKIDRETARKMLLAAWESGVNYYDTAYRYHEGESQEFMGEVLAELPRDQLFFANKLPIWLVKNPADTDKYLNEQLAASQTDYFDFYLVHAMDAARFETMKKHGVYETLCKRRQEGKIRLLGFSYHGDWETFQRMMEEYEWDFVQIQINYIDDIMSQSRDYYDLLCQKGVPCIVMEPVRGGFLANLPQAALDELAVSGAGAYSPAQWALRWCMARDNMRVILSGMSTMEQVDENTALFSDPLAEQLSGEEAAMMERVRDKVLAVKTIPCTACGYCMDCPSGVDIPAVFDVYNRYKLFGGEFEAWRSYSDLTRRDAAAGQCVRCGVCLPMCPQGLDIPERLAEVHAVMAPKLEE